jgi:hypothetical protein
VQGEVFRTAHLIIEPVIAKDDVAIDKGDLVCNDGTGFVKATQALAATSAVYVAMESVTTTQRVRKFKVCMSGAVYVKATVTGGIKQGQKLAVHTTAGIAKAATSSDVVIGVAAYDTTAPDAVSSGVPMRF